jgi:hypothetical protein
MSKTIRFAIVVGLFVMLLVLELVRWNIDTQVRAFQQNSETASKAPFPSNVRMTSPFTARMIPIEEEAEVQKIYLKPRLNEHNAGIWAVLQRRVPIPFGEETPLGDFIQYIKTATRSSERPAGLSIYVDPIGLEETEKTIDSPILFEMKGLPLAQSLELVLGQLGLAYWVEENGLIVISAGLARESKNAADADLEILEQIQHLRDEVAAMRLEMAAARGIPPTVTPPPGMWRISGAR